MRQYLKTRLRPKSSMPAPYSYDLRSKAIAAVKRGEKKIHICCILKISRNTLNLWLKREEKTGDVQALKPLMRGQRPKIKDEKKFCEFVLKNNDKTQQQIAELWGDNVTQQNVSRLCKKIGITRKKNLWVSRKR